MPLPLRVAALVLTGCAGCTQALEPSRVPLPAGPAPQAEQTVVPGNIGVFVELDQKGVVVSELKERGPAAEAGVRVGDVVLRFNGELVSDPAHFARLVHDSPPGSVAQLELWRNGETRIVQVHVKQLRTTPRA